MAVANAELAATLARTADLLELTGANPFRVRAYRAGARRIDSLGRPVADMLAAAEDLTALPDIGQDLAGGLAELVETGRLTLLEELEAAVPPGLPALLEIEGLGPKRARRLWQELGIVDAESLRTAAEAGRVRELAGFGAKSEANLLLRLAELSRRSPHLLISDAAALAEALRGDLTAIAGVRRIEIAGALRRGCETIGELDLVAVADAPDPLLDALCGHRLVERTIMRGPTQASVMLRRGVPADLRIVPATSFGAALLCHTGSREHYAHMQRRAAALGMRLSENGIEGPDGPLIAAVHSEEFVFDSIGLQFIPPELREGIGEVEQAAQGGLPALVELRDIRGNLHTHSDWSDGTRSIREMAEEARRRGLEYLAITDHSFGLAVANGLDSDRLLRQTDEIASINESLDDFVLLTGIECDITTDGDLELPDDVLRRLDIVIGAVHRNFRLSRDAQTRRVLRALENPWLTCLAHPTGRLLTRRNGYDIDLESVLAAAADRGVMVEINASPWRLDLNDVHARRARDLGIRVPINTDAHGFEDFDHLRWGVLQARRAGLTADDVPNAQPLADLRRLLAVARSG